MALGRSRWVSAALAGAGALFAAGWLVTTLVPAGRAMMLDMAFAFGLGVAVAGLLWWTARHQPGTRRFWRLLAAGWTVALAASLAWGLYEALTGQELPDLSAIDGLYLVRYALVLAAFGLCLTLRTRRRRAGLAAIIVLAAAGTWLGLLRPVEYSTGMAFSGLLAYAVYPFLDVVTAGLCGWAWLSPAAGRLRSALGLLLLAMIAYGTANWINFFLLTTGFSGLSSLPNLFWPVSDLLAGLAALVGGRAKPSSAEITMARGRAV